MSASSNSSMSSSSLSSSPSSMSSNDSPLPVPKGKAAPAKGKAPVKEEAKGKAPAKGKGKVAKEEVVETAPVNPPETKPKGKGAAKGKAPQKEEVAPKVEPKGKAGKGKVAEEEAAPKAEPKGKAVKGKAAAKVDEAPEPKGKSKGKAVAKEEAPKAEPKGKSKGKATKEDGDSESDGKSDKLSPDNLVNYIRKLARSDPGATWSVSTAALHVLDKYVEAIIRSILKQVTSFASIKHATTFNVDLFNKAIKSLDTRNVLEEMEDHDVSVVFPAPRIRRRIQQYTTLPEGDALKIRMGKESPVAVATAIRSLLLFLIPRTVQEMEKKGNKTILPRHVVAALQSSHELDNFVAGVTADAQGEVVTLADFTLDFDSLRKPTAKSRAKSDDAAPAKGKAAAAPAKGGKTTKSEEAPAKGKAAAAPAKGGKTTKSEEAPKGKAESKPAPKGKGKVVTPPSDSESDIDSDSDVESAPKAPAKGKGGKGKK